MKQSVFIVGLVLACCISSAWTTKTKNKSWKKEDAKRSWTASALTLETADIDKIERTFGGSCDGEHMNGARVKEIMYDICNVTKKDGVTLMELSCPLRCVFAQLGYITPHFRPIYNRTALLHSILEKGLGTGKSAKAIASAIHKFECVDQLPSNTNLDCRAYGKGLNCIGAAILKACKIGV